MEEKLLEWFMDVLENDGHDIREIKGKIRLAIKILNRTGYSWDRKAIIADLIDRPLGEDEENA